MSDSEIKISSTAKFEAGDTLEFVVFVDGAPCPHVDLVKLYEHEAKQLAAYALIQKDLETTLEMSESLLRDTTLSEIARQSLFYSSIFTYGRCFTDAAQGRKVKLEATADWLGADPLSVRCHEMVMEIRHKYLAHGGATAYEFIYLNGSLHPDKTRKSVVAVAPFIVSAKVLDDAIISNFHVLYTNVMLNVNNKVKKLTERILQKLSTEPIDELYQQANYPTIKTDH